jgi:integrase
VIFLRHCATVADPLAELYEVILGTGMRKGEALGLHWADVHLEEKMLFVRYTLSNINNTTLDRSRSCRHSVVDCR